MESLWIGKRVIEYEMKKSRKAKRVSIVIKNQRVRVAVPTGFTLEYARSFLEDNKEWILKHLQKQTAENKGLLPKNYVSGEKLLYRGRKYPLKVEETEGSEHYALFKGSRIIAYIPTGLPPKNQALTVKRLTEEWYINQAIRLLPEQVEFYAKILGIAYNKLNIKDQKTRWGSCSNKGNINFNWRIIMAPNQVSAYVIIHELAHLKHMNHSKEFWQTVEQLLPDYKKWRKWLVDNGKELLG